MKKTNLSKSLKHLQVVECLFQNIHNFQSSMEKYDYVLYMHVLDIVLLIHETLFPMFRFLVQCIQHGELVVH